MDLADSHWGILEACSEHRETRANLAATLDLSPDYVSTKLSELRDYELIEQPGPAEKSGMWHTTLQGDLAVEKRDKYQKRHAELFGQLVNNATNLAAELRAETGGDIAPNDIIITSTDAWHALHKLENESRIKTHTAAELLPQDNIYAVHGLLYELWFFGLLDRTETSEGEIYRVTVKGDDALDRVNIKYVTPENINRSWLGFPEQRGE